MSKYKTRWLSSPVTQGIRLWWLFPRIHDNHIPVFTPQVHLVTFACFYSICMTSVTSSYPMKLRVMYAYCSSVSEARLSNQHGRINMCWNVMLWRSVLLDSYYIFDDWDSTCKCIYCLLWLSIKVFWWFLLLCLTFIFKYLFNFCLGAAILISLPK